MLRYRVVNQCLQLKERANSPTVLVRLFGF
jgi:hypothetical protein